MCWAGLKPKAWPMLWALHGLGPGFIFLKPKAWAQARAFNPYIEIPLVDIACGQIMRSNRIINIILYTWDITVIVPPMEFEYGLKKEIDRLQVYYDTGKNPKDRIRIQNSLFDQKQKILILFRGQSDFGLSTCLP